MNDLHFAEVERLFGDLLCQAKEVLSESNLNEVRHFIDVGEYGLALLTFVDIVHETETPLLAPLKQAVQDLSRIMEMDNEIRLE